MKANTVKSMACALCAIMFTAQFAQADVAFWVTGTKKSVTAYGGLSYSVIDTETGHRLYLTKKSAKKFEDCENGEYQIVRNSAIGQAVYLLLNMTCND